MNIFKKTYEWALFAIASCAAIIFSYRYFPDAFPLIHLNLTMDRTQAVLKAEQIAQTFHLGPQNARHATSFETDETTKTFIELQAGGKDAVVSMMKQNLYQIYTWHVRIFKPFEHHETALYFTPDGTPYGFKETLSEDTPGTNVGSDHALQIAQSLAQAQPWHIDFTQYKVIEMSHEKKTSGRIDHTIVYERIKEKIGKGEYRLNVVVSGDHVSQLTHSVKVPDEFLRSYKEMRSANETIAHWAQIIMLVLYLFGCLFIGLLFLIKKQWIIWRPALWWALLIGTLTSLTVLNALPIHWIRYNTALSPAIFIVQLIVQVLIIFLIYSGLCAAVFLGAEGLTRHAFGNQLQLWHLFAPSVSSSYTILGYTISAYLLVPLLLAYGVLFYTITSHFFGWWIPSSALFDPNVLAAYFPWLTSIAVSLQAGFLEECLFRAIPLATAALLGTRYGKRNWWIAGAFILQAIVFGAAHANYPSHPAYARLVELLMISSVFGGIYLKFGLLISIIAHFVYDVFWFALPLFVSSAPSAWINKAIVIALTGIPLWIVAISRIRIGAWLTIPAAMYNRAWAPHRDAAISSKETPASEIPHEAPSPRTPQRWIILISGIIGFISWISFTRFKSDTPVFSTNRLTIMKNAQDTLRTKQIDPSAWYPIVYALTQFEQQPALLKQHRFIWQQGGASLYQQLIGSYLSPQQWIARFATWDGTITKRSEEHHLFFLPDGTLQRYAHKLPETAPGASLSKEQAREKALAVIKEKFDRTKDQLKEVGVIATKQPERLDWKITYASTVDYPIDTGEARLEVLIAGDEITDTYRYIHVPEQWERSYENRQALAHIIQAICQLIVLILMFIFIILGLSRWHFRVTKGLLINSIWLTIMLAFALFNYWPSIIAGFNTSQPFQDQIFRFLSISFIITIIQAVFLAVMISLVTQIHTIAYNRFISNNALIVGISFGTILAGALSCAQWIIGTLSPTWAQVGPLSNLIPLIGGIDTQLVLYLSTTINISLFIILVDMATKGGHRNRWLAIVILLLAGFTRAGLIDAYNVPLLITNGFLISLIFILGYILVWRFDRSSIPITTGTYVSLYLMQQLMFHAYPGAIAAYIIAILLIMGGSWYWHRQIKQAA